MRSVVASTLLATILAGLLGASAPARAATPAPSPVATPAPASAPAPLAAPAPPSKSSTGAPRRNEEITPLGAAWRSSLLPGWGQRYKGETRKGWVFTGVFAGLLTGSAIASNEKTAADRAYRRLDNSASNASFDSAYQRDVNTTLAAQITGGITAAFWAYAVGDSYFSGVDKLRVKDARIHDVFPSMAKYWQTNPFASVIVENRSAEPITNIKLKLEAPEVMRVPAEAPAVESLSPGLAREISLRAAFGDAVFDVGRSEPRAIQARLTVEYETGHKRKKIERTATFTVYNRNAIVWDDVRKLGSFVTPRESSVVAFASDAARRKVQIAAAKNVSMAAVFFDAMSAAGISYLSDPETPFTQVEGNAAAVDSVSFPHETLARRTGDCDDLTALYASLLESAGIATALVDVPGHVFVMFDSGLKADEFRRVLGNDRFVLRNGGAWIPVETTSLGKPFNAAWATGLDEARKWTGLSKLNAVEVLVAQTTYPANIPAFADAPAARVDQASFDKLVALDLSSAASAETRGEDRGLAEVKARHLPPDQEANEIGILLAGQGKLDDALKSFRQALAINPRFAKAKNNVGNVTFALGDKTAALAAYLEALALDRESVPVLENLAALYYELGQSRQAVEFYLRAVRLDPACEIDYPEIAALSKASDSATVQRPVRPGAPATGKASVPGPDRNAPAPGKFVP